ncbi:MULTISPECIES: VanZ family protein [Metabacillus]|uniref:Teicoplanin resistance protein VanZ n=2 Tax=Metabacillus TaxID=2675233 RepID=A0A179TAI1_9BACI|nr:MULTISPECIES: VanZ family protein [Metabacillus]OAS89443.1 teicoplanin resistance protein VanZ [Metabacillus litoralis]QNF28962.1 VanZ family protein [Metabacillus sp. KUDC1714]
MSIMFTINSWFILVPLFFIFVLFMIYFAKSRKQSYSIFQYTLLTSFVIYILGVIYFVFLPIDVNFGKYANQAPWYSSTNIIPILTIDLKTFLLNIMMLIPFGMYLPFINKRFDSVKSVAKLGFSLSFSIEVIQLLIRVSLGSARSTDINDLIANTLGSVLGYLLINILSKSSFAKNVMNKFSLS